MARNHTLSAVKLILCGLGLPALSACQVDLGSRVPESTASFGNIVYRETCERVAYTADLQARAKDPSLPLDLSGTSHMAYCGGSGAPPAGADPSVRALDGQRQLIVGAVDQAFPDGLLTPFDLYLRSLAPLQDDGTVTTLLTRTGALLSTMSQDQGLTQGLSHLGAIGGVRAPDTAGGLLRSAAGAPGLDDVIGAALPLFISGGAARQQFLALLGAGAFESRHLTQAANLAAQLDPERTAALLGALSLSTSAGLSTGKPLLIARRDGRGMPLLRVIQAPYVVDPQTLLAQADAAGRFVDAGGSEIPYVPPLPEPGQADSAMRDAAGRAVWPDGTLLYQYVDLDQSLLMGLLRDGHRLFATSLPGHTTEVNIPFGLLQGAAPLSGSRNPAAQRTEDGETYSFNGYKTSDNVLLDLIYGAVQLVRFKGDAQPPSPAGEDLQHVLQAVLGLMQNDAAESPLARSLKALLDAADTAKLPDYAAAVLPADSTLFDDLAPVIVRILLLKRIEAGTGRTVTLLEDVVTALQDPRAQGLGPITAQLAQDRDYFFMRQLGAMDGLDNLPTQCAPDADEADNGLTPCGVVGNFGNQSDRSAPDADATIDWRGKMTSDPRDNRSVLQRLLHVLADTNGTRPFCNGRNAWILGGFLVFNNECDMFQVNDIARFFLLSIASPALRMDPATFAKQGASFLEAIKNSNNCQCVAGGSDPKTACQDVQAKMKCNALLSSIDDGVNGDNVLSGLMGIANFGRYPEPNVGGRALFLDVSAATTGSLLRTQALLFNHVATSSPPAVDTGDPDNRKFIDGSGQTRLLVEEHNGVLFALEKAQATVSAAGGGTQTVNFYQAMRPLVDAFARHFECFDPGWKLGQACTAGQNATQILADAMTVLHRHWPTAQSSIFGRSFADSYGTGVKADGVTRYEPLLAKVMTGDLLPSTPALSPILLGLTYTDDGGAQQKALPLLGQLGRFVMDPSLWPTPGAAGALTYRDQTRPATAARNDSQPAYQDATLTKLLGKDYSGTLTPYYLLADGLRKRQAILDMQQNAAAKQSFNQAVSDAIDVFLQVQQDAPGLQGYSFQDRQLRPMGVLLLNFLQGRVQAHAADPLGWSQQLMSDLADPMTGTMSGPLYAALLDLGIQLSTQDDARRKTYTLLGQLLDPANAASLRAMGSAAADAVQVLPDDADLVPIGRGLAGALDEKSGPVDPGLTLLKRGRDLEISNNVPMRPVLIKVLGNMYQPDQVGTYPMFRISDAIAEVDRATPGKGGDLSAVDYQVLLQTTGKFLVDNSRGLQRFIDIVQSRCLAGSLSSRCPKGK